jgi:hypothetical protein
LVKNQKEGLEVEFAIETALKQVLLMPSAYSPRYKNVRIANPKAFPYNIHFYIDQDAQTVVFIAIVHNKRDPQVAIKRME